MYKRQITGTLTFTDAADGDSSPNYEVTTDPAGGNVSIDPVTGVWTYVPATDFNGVDTFTVTVTDDDGHTEEQDVEVTLSAVNDTGTFGGDTSENGVEGDPSITGTLTFTDVIDGDSSPNYEVTTDPSGGTASIDPVTGVWTYEPDADFNGVDTFTVTVTDDDGHTEEQLSLIHI